MKITGNSYIVGTHRYSFRAGKAAKILRVVSMKPNETAEERVAFEVEYPDGVKDFIAVGDCTAYKILSASELRTSD